MSKKIDFEMIELVAVLADEGNFTIGGRRIGAAPAILKRRLAALEEELALSLFSHNGDDVVVTEDGRAFVEACCSFYEHTKKLRDRGSVE